MLTATEPQFNLVDSAQFLEDPSGTLRVDDVRRMDAQFQPWTRGGSALNFGFTSSAYWVRVPLQRAAHLPADWLLEVHYAKLHQLDWYPPQAPDIHTGSSLPLSTRPIFDRHFVFPVHVPTEQEYLYLRATSQYPLTIPLTLWKPDAFQQQQQRFQLLQFMYYGSLVILALYGLLTFAALSDSRFLVYGAYIVSAGLGVFASNGYGRQLLWPNTPAFDDISQSLFFSLGAYFAVMFARKLLLTSTERSWLTALMQISQQMFLVTCGLTLLGLAWPIILRPANQLLMLNSVAMGVLVSLASLRAYRQGQEGVRFFLMGWLALWLGVCVAVLRAFDWIPTTSVTAYALQISMVIEMIMIGMALADLLRLEHDALISAQQQVLNTQQALLKISQTSEETLKQAVHERTEQLQASLQQEQHLREQYVRFGAMISHEFRTPLGIILSQASLMRKEHDRGMDHVHQRLDAIGSASQRLKVMFDKWLQSDEIHQRLEAMAVKPLPLNAWLHDLIEHNHHLLLQAVVHWELDPTVTDIQADAYHLGIALTNLLDNAVKYSPAHSTLTVSTRHKPGWVGLAVTDQGPGIPLEMQDRIFGEYYRLEPESHIRGVGLGLSIVQQIARAHGGSVEVNSTPGQGATFCIWIPQ